VSNSHVLIATSDNKLRAELLETIEQLGNRAPATTCVDSYRKGIEAARNRAPNLILVELTEDVEDLRVFAHEIAVNAPHASIAAVFRPETFDAEASESAAIIAALRAGVKDFLRRPVSSTELLELLDRSREPSAVPTRAEGKVISFISNKGGVGKSTLAVNTAVGLALPRPGRVLLIDASLQMGVAASMLDVSPNVTLSDVANERTRLDETMLRQMVTVHESGLHLLAAPADAVEAAAVDDELMSRILTLGRRSYDYVVVDTFPLFDRVVVAVLDVCDLAIVVVENVVPTVVGAAKMLEVLDSIGYPRERLRVVVNRMTSIAGGLSAEDVGARLGNTIHTALPYDKKVIAAANIGRPFVMQAQGFLGNWNRFGRRLNALVRDVEHLQPDRNGHENGEGIAEVPDAVDRPTSTAQEGADDR